MKINKFIGGLAGIVLALTGACGTHTDGNADTNPNTSEDAGYSDAGNKPDAGNPADAGYKPDANYTDGGQTDAGNPVDAGPEVRAVLKYSLTGPQGYQYEPREIIVARNQDIMLNFCDSIINEQVAGYKISDETGRNVNHLKEDCKGMLIYFPTTGVYNPKVQPIDKSIEPVGESDSFKVNVN